MQYKIDISVFSPDKAVGMISGPFEFSQAPLLGSIVKLSRSNSSHAAPHITGFSWQLAIESLVKYEEPGCLGVMLEDLCVDSDTDAVAVMSYLEQEFGLFVDYWEENPNSNDV